MTHPRCSSCNPVRKEVQNKTCLQEDILEHGDDLQCEYVLSTIIADLEDSGLPHVVFRLLRYPVIINIVTEDGPFFANFEGCHKRSLYLARVSTWDVDLMGYRYISYLGVTLQRSTGFTVQIHNDPVGITRQIDSN